MVSIMDYDRQIRNAYQSQLGSISALRQQAYTNIYNGGYATTSNTGISGCQLTWQPDTLPGDVRHGEPKPAKHPDLAWLDKRVDELRVKL